MAKGTQQTVGEKEIEMPLEQVLIFIIPLRGVGSCLTILKIQVTLNYFLKYLKTCCATKARNSYQHSELKLT